MTAGEILKINFIFIVTFFTFASYSLSNELVKKYKYCIGAYETIYEFLENYQTDSKEKKVKLNKLKRKINNLEVDSEYYNNEICYDSTNNECTYIVVNESLKGWSEGYFKWIDLLYNDKKPITDKEFSREIDKLNKYCREI